MWRIVEAFVLLATLDLQIYPQTPTYFEKIYILFKGLIIHPKIYFFLIKNKSKNQW